MSLRYSVALLSLGALIVVAPHVAAQQAASTGAYQNYDFVPGDTIIFADDFLADPDGEFPTHWQLKSGQAVINARAGYQAFLLTDGNYAAVAPRMKSPSYLGPQFTIEYDVYGEPGSYPLALEFTGANGTGIFRSDRNDAYFVSEGVDLVGHFPASMNGDNYDAKWHHVALVYRKPQLKVYMDQYRVLTVPETNLEPKSVVFEGIGNQETPIVFRNVRIASGGSMNMLGKKFTEAKIVAHGINFDVDKATLRPESMGTLNQIKGFMNADPALTFEVDGHTDNSGGAAHNLTLAAQRADAVKAELVNLGIAADRLTTKGFGDSKPLTANDTPEGKANNRRVEFVRTSKPAA